MKKITPLIIFIIFGQIIPFLGAAELPLQPSPHDLVFQSLALRWDETKPSL